MIFINILLYKYIILITQFVLLLYQLHISIRRILLNLMDKLFDLIPFHTI
jgi:hypothetical protein